MFGRKSTLWRRCERIASAVRLPDPFDVTTLFGEVAAMRGRPIELVALDARPGAPCGVLAATDRADYIFYTRDTSPLHQRHILLHELGHLLCGHVEGEMLPETVAAMVTPSLSVDLVRRVLGRTTYAQEQEKEAELVASLLMRRAVSTGPGSDRLRHALGS
ncbi:ImmA/IrrE family metallo-endopeptidase [Amycolatopsis speibonae]|uniref:ImmA/IrrE family metallo-endopeptidase n=1 Tax=Amycolatopsis speibonae TaxID=1450224 RepID=A0ABV7P4J1_9PSEU